jgi:predicted CXXCH cytochrome family protein
MTGRALRLGLVAVPGVVAALVVFRWVGPDPGPGVETDAEYVGSGTCQSCHQDIYDRWQDTLMANVLIDPAERPEVVLGDFSTPDPLVTFTLDQVAFTYGSKWKQRYFTQVGDDYAVFPAQWDVTHRVWRPYYPQQGSNWWTDHYPEDPMLRPTGPLCDGCHSTNYDIVTGTPTEWNVGCEKCHGPGSTHLEEPQRRNIVNPARLDLVRGVDVCIQCHSQGRPLANPIDGLYYDWPVGYEPGDRLSQTWRLEEHLLGEESFTHWPEGSAHKNRMQGNDFVQSAMYLADVGCWGCHDVHGTPYEADLIGPADTNATCLECHEPGSPDGPAGTLEQHTRHAPESEGSLCVGCHMPPTARTLADVNLRSHTFRFVTPAMTEAYGIPNGCTACHTDRTNAWAREALLGWDNLSPWRVAP